METLRYGIALGSNLGDRLVHLQTARSSIADLLGLELENVLQGKIYETPPIDCPDGSGRFLNTVIEIPSSLAPLELLRETQRIEGQMGRIRSLSNAPRTIDIDLLYSGDLTVEHGDLILPHPRMHERLFVLRPLNDIRPDLHLAACDLKVADQLQVLLRQESDVACFATVW